VQLKNPALVPVEKTSFQLSGIDKLPACALSEIDAVELPGLPGNLREHGPHTRTLASDFFKIVCQKNPV
jgi:hypothetical protein